MADRIKNSMEMTRRRMLRVFLLILADTLIVCAAYILTVFLFSKLLRTSYIFPFHIGGDSAFPAAEMATIIVISLLSFLVFRMYSSLWSQSGLDESLNILCAVACATLCMLLVNIVFGNINKRIIVIAEVVQLPLLFASRMGIRIVRRIVFTANGRLMRNKLPLMIVGAGKFCVHVIKEIEYNQKETNYFTVLLVDDAPEKQGMRVHGVPVRGKICDIPQLAKKYGIKEIVIAIPSASEQRISEIIEICAKTKCHVRVAPSVREINDANMNMASFRDISINDVLFRNEVVLNKEKIADYVRGKTVLVTGGGGSIGSEIARQIATFSPDKLILFDIYENTTYELFFELTSKYPKLNVFVRIGSVREKSRVLEVMHEFSPQVVVHTAAHKHVPLMEESPAESVKNNVFGTLNVVSAADECGVLRFVQLSTDKAVNPTSVMGATKRITELIVQDYATKTNMLCATVRFGNVLGSHGSVIPQFEKQIKNGGPVYVTHPDITRYFMTIPEAAQLVLEACSFGKTGEIYVLDMGEPVKIIDLAKRMIEFHGYVPNVDIKIEICGLRPGEKLYEELLTDTEKNKMRKSEHNRIMIAPPTQIDSEKLKEQLCILSAAAEAGNTDAVKARIRDIVPEYDYVGERV